MKGEAHAVHLPVVGLSQTIPLMIWVKWKSNRISFGGQPSWEERNTYIRISKMCQELEHNFRNKEEEESRRFFDELLLPRNWAHVVSHRKDVIVSTCGFNLREVATTYYLVECSFCKRARSLALFCSYHVTLGSRGLTDQSCSITAQTRLWPCLCGRLEVVWLELYVVTTRRTGSLASKSGIKTSIWFMVN